MQAFHFLHEQTKEHDLQNMTLDEIHEKSTRQAIGRIKRYTKNGIEEADCYIEELNDDEAIIYMVDSNIYK